MAEKSNRGFEKHGGTTTVADMRPGENAVVTHVHATGAVRQRLLDMGILTRCEVAVERKAPTEDPIWIRLNNFQLSLRKKEAAEESETLREALAKDYTPLVALSMIIFLLIATPCMATFAVVRRESGSTMWGLYQFFGLTAIGYVLSLIVYQGGQVLGLG